MGYEKLNLKTLAIKATGHFFIITLILVLPPASLNFILPSVTISVITLVLFVYAVRRCDSKLYLLYSLGSLMLVLLLGLRSWDISIGLSWILLASLLPGFLVASFIPFVARNFSEVIHRITETQFIMSLFIFAPVAMPIIGVLWATVSQTMLFQENKLLYISVGVFTYISVVMGIHANFHLFANKNLSRWIKMDR